MAAFSGRESDIGDKSRRHNRHERRDRTVVDPDAQSGTGDTTRGRCSLCGEPFDRQDSTVFPFCSVRCQQIDLGHWLNEDFGLPVAGHEDRPAPPADESEQATGHRGNQTTDRDL